MNCLIIWLVCLIVMPILIVCGEGLYWEIRINIEIKQMEKIQKELEQEVK